jgi:hypothetical protein
MKELSGRASTILEHYKAVESLRETEKGRLLETLQSRAARGDVPRASTDLEPPLRTPSVDRLHRVWTGPFAKTRMGVMAVAVAAVVVGVAVTRPMAPGRLARVTAAAAEDPGTLNHARPEPEEATADEELRLLRRAQLALRSGDARHAMALLDQHAAQFPWSRLADAREVMRMDALCDLGARSLAREKAEGFLAQHPGSPLSDRVRRICTDSEP